jgi:hypothetical protein
VVLKKTWPKAASSSPVASRSSLPIARAISSGVRRDARPGWLGRSMSMHPSRKDNELRRYFLGNNFRANNGTYNHHYKRAKHNCWVISKPTLKH